jgi:hypothetical protein
MRGSSRSGVEDFIFFRIGFAGKLGERRVVILPQLRVALLQNVQESLAKKKNLRSEYPSEK